MIVNNFILSCCSTADLSASHYEKRNIKTIPFHFSLDGIEYLDDGSMPIDKFYKDKAKVLFLERLNYYYNNFSRSIPYPKLRIRKMKSRWGVCNTKTHVITLNLELMKRDIKY